MNETLISDLTINIGLPSNKYLENVKGKYIQSNNNSSSLTIETNECLYKDSWSNVESDLSENNDKSRKPNNNPSCLYISNTNIDTRRIVTINVKT